MTRTFAAHSGGTPITLAKIIQNQQISSKKKIGALAQNGPIANEPLDVEPFKHRTLSKVLNEREGRPGGVEGDRPPPSPKAKKKLVQSAGNFF